MEHTTKNILNQLKTGAVMAMLLLSFSAFSQTAVQQSTAEQSQQLIPEEQGNVVTPGVIYGDQEIAKGEIPALLMEAEPASGGIGELEYIWMEYVKVGSLPAQWYPIPSATSADFQPGALTKTTQYMRCVRRSGNDTFLNSNIITVKMAANNG